MVTKVSNLSNLVAIERTIVSKDGTTKFLLRLNDGERIECVLMMQEYGNTVCISSQVGCKMGCVFCASGACGFVRNLTFQEMLAQVMVAKKHCTKENPLTHVVIMGIGEPFDNFDAVMEFLDAVDIGARRISVSTCGLPDKIKEFADRGLGVNLCISLHASNDTIRKHLMPIARAHTISDVLAAAKYFFEKTHRRVIFEYALIKDVNCLHEHALELARLIKSARISAHINLITLNHTAATSAANATTIIAPPTHKQAMDFMDTLIKNGVSCTMRKARGTDIMAACGQLRLDAIAPKTNTPGMPVSLRKKDFTHPELSISLDPAYGDGKLKEYLMEINHFKNVSIHLDIMRDSYVDTNKISFKEYKYVVSHAKHPVDVHIMAGMEDSNFVFDVLFKEEPRSYCFHLEVVENEPYPEDTDHNPNHQNPNAPAVQHLHGKYYEMIAAENIKNSNIGMAIDLESDVYDLPFQIIGTLTIMCVKAGASGQKFNISALEKIRYVKKYHPEIRIIADGGINKDNIELVARAGADVIVVGSAIYKRPSTLAREQAVKELLDILHTI